MGCPHRHALRGIKLRERNNKSKLEERGMEHLLKRLNGRVIRKLKSLPLCATTQTENLTGHREETITEIKFHTASLFEPQEESLLYRLFWKAGAAFHKHSCLITFNCAIWLRRCLSSPFYLALLFFLSLFFQTAIQ